MAGAGNTGGTAAIVGQPFGVQPPQLTNEPQMGFPLRGRPLQSPQLNTPQSGYSTFPGDSFTTQISFPPGEGLPQSPQLNTPQSAQQPNIFNTAAGGINRAVNTAAGETSFQPMMVRAGTGLAALAGSGIGEAALAGSGTAQAALARSGTAQAALAGSGIGEAALAESGTAQADIASYVDKVNAERVAAGQIAGTDLSAYMNPYESQVVGQSLSDLDRARQMQAMQLNAQATRAGAFGGSRQALMQSELGRNYLDQSARTASGLRQAGFQNAQQLAGQDIASRMQADLANQSTGLQAGTTNAQLAQQVNLANQASRNNMSQFNVGNQLQASLANQAARNNMSQFNVENQLQASLANQAAQNNMSQFNVGNQFQESLANQAARNNTSQFNVGNQFQASLANQGARNNMSQFNIGNQLQTSLANQGARNNMSQFNIGNQLQASLANQGATLAGSQQRLNAAGQLGSASNLGFGMGMDLQNQAMQQGALEQGINQMILDRAQAQYAGMQGAPAQSLGYLSQALGATPTPMTQTNTRNPGLFDYLTLGATTLGGGRR
jgi:hypothetical protein